MDELADPDGGRVAVAGDADADELGVRDEFPEIAARFVPIRQYNGLPLDATTVVEGVLSDRKAPGKKG